MWSDTLSTVEAEATERAIETLTDVAWASPVVAHLEEAGGFSSENKPLMFEVRYAAALHVAGTEAEYEHAAGVGDSSVDFRLPGQPAWLIECVSIRASDAAKASVRQVGLIYEQLLSSDADDQRQSPQGEMIIAEQKIAQKAYNEGQPTKFPVPAEDQYHLIMVDARGYLDGGGDVFDYRQMAYGWKGVPRDQDCLVHWWRDASTDERVPVMGVFEEKNPLASSSYVRERVHFIGFVSEKDYEPDEIRRRTYMLANPWLFQDEEAAQVAWETYPIRPEERNTG